MSECSFKCALIIGTIGSIPILLSIIVIRWLLKKLFKKDVKSASNLITYAWLFASSVIGLTIAAFMGGFYLKNNDNPFWLDKPSGQWDDWKWGKTDKDDD